MKPIKFDKQNSALTRPLSMSSETCGLLPIYRTTIDVISCWKMNWRERFAGLFYGRVWIKIRAGMTHPPID